MKREGPRTEQRVQDGQARQSHDNNPGGSAGGGQHPSEGVRGRRGSPARRDL